MSELGNIVRILTDDREREAHEDEGSTPFQPVTENGDND
jgi:hypothetical protein